MSYTTVPENTIVFRPAAKEDVARCAELEAAGYPSDEAASTESLTFRQANAPDYFLVATKNDDEIVGFVCGTLTASSDLTHESMSEHESAGTLLCIHSVCVDEAYRRKKIATRALKAYLTCVSQINSQITEVRLICKEKLIPLYEGAGFRLLGASSIQHGKDQWFECLYTFD